MGSADGQSPPLLTAQQPTKNEEFRRRRKVIEKKLKKSLTESSSRWQYITGELHEGKFHVGDLLEPAIFDSFPWAYVMCNWAQISLHRRN